MRVITRPSAGNMQPKKEKEKSITINSLKLPTKKHLPTILAQQIIRHRYARVHQNKRKRMTGRQRTNRQWSTSY